EVPAPVDDGSWLEPREPPAVEATHSPIKKRGVTPEAHVARAILEDRIHARKAIQPTVGGKAIPGELHGSGVAHRQPQIARRVFAERVDERVREPVLLVVGAQPTALGVATREELHQALGVRHPESLVGRLEQLPDRDIRQSVIKRESVRHMWWSVTRVSSQAEESGVARGDPQTACVILVEVREVVAW